MTAEEARALAERVLADRLARSRFIGTTKSGRSICTFVGEPTPAERQWTAAQQEARACRSARTGSS